MNQSIIYIKTILLSAIITLAISCGNKHTEEDGHNHGDTSELDEENGSHNSDSENEEHDEEGLQLTKAQAKTVGLEFGNISAIKVNDFINTTGTLGLPPNAMAAVSAKSVVKFVVL